MNPPKLVKKFKVGERKPPKLKPPVELLSEFEEKVDRLACLKMQWTGLGQCPYTDLDEEVAKLRDQIIERMTR